MQFFRELRRRQVVQVGIAYLVVAWGVAQVADLVLDNYDAPGWIMQVILAVLGIGFPVAVILSWVFDLRWDGLQRESDLAAGKTAPVLPAQKADHNSVAVLPFADMSPDKDQEYLSDGIAEELLNLLAKIPELRVISRSSAFSYKGKDIKMAQIAEELNVAHILEGSVRKVGNRVRITTQLIEARSDTHLWSETYDRTLDDIFAIQDEIAATVVEQLKVKLLGEVPHVVETDPQAYALYLQARHLGRQFTAEGWEESNALYKRVLAIDPDYAAAWDGLAANYSNMAYRDLLPSLEGYGKALEATEQALAIDPDFALAHSGLGWIAMFYENDLAKAARHFERAMQLDPSNVSIIGNAATLLRQLGRLDEAIATGEYVAARDPVNSSIHYNLAGHYFFAGRWNQAVASYDTALRLSPDYLSAHYFKGLTLLFKDDPEAALESFIQEGDEEFRVKGQALALYALGRQEEHREKLQELIGRWGDEWPSEVAHVYAYIGEADRAFEWLNKSALEEDDAFNPNELLLRPLVDDPRWLPLLESIGKSPEQFQLNAIEFEVTLPK